MSYFLKFQTNPDERTLRHFGWIALVVFNLLALFIILKRGNIEDLVGDTIWLLISMGLIIVGLLSGALSRFYPSGNRLLFIILSGLAYPFGFVLGLLLMSAFFYLLITPIGLIRRVLGYDSLKRYIEKNKSTYWEVSREDREPHDYFKQF